MAIIVKNNNTIYYYKDGHCPPQYQAIGVYVDDDFLPPKDGRYHLDIQLGRPIWIQDYSINELKNEMIQQSKNKLNLYLQNNPIKWINGKYYSITLEKQKMMQMQLFLYSCAKDNGYQNYKLMWNATGEEAEEWQYEDLLNLSLEIDKMIQPLIQYQRYKEIEIKKCQTVDDLDGIVINYNNITK